VAPVDVTTLSLLVAVRVSGAPVFGGAYLLQGRFAGRSWWLCVAGGARSASRGASHQWARYCSGALPCSSRAWSRARRSVAAGGWLPAVVRDRPVAPQPA